jgi:adenylate cyclase class 2
MTNDNIEIEIRFPLDEKIFSELREKLKKTAKFVKKSHQKDDYFTPVHRNFLDLNLPSEWLRIRTKDGKTMLNYKHWYYPDGVDSGTHCNEFETQVENPEQLNKIFSALDFKKLLTVEKNREIYIYNNQFEISLDSVKNLGHFIEIEAKKNFGSIKQSREKLFDFAKSLGLDISNVDKKGYAFLMAKKKGLIKR